MGDPVNATGALPRNEDLPKIKKEISRLVQKRDRWVTLCRNFPFCSLLMKLNESTVLA